MKSLSRYRGMKFPFCHLPFPVTCTFERYDTESPAKEEALRSLGMPQRPLLRTFCPSSGTTLPKENETLKDLFVDEVQ
jgi:hypothetical protein